MHLWICYFRCLADPNLVFNMISFLPPAPLTFMERARGEAKFLYPAPAAPVIGSRVGGLQNIPLEIQATDF